ncbi:SDR family oxidoreductase [Zhouia sp. PK063]|uniref:SDR family oxidoreductase n=1 Tax=Zhouia sp. PK063 TaxID=3373602 RepID=UPI0037898AFE
MKIIVTGSLGNISTPLTQYVIQQGHTVTVISRNPDKQKNIEALGATAAIGTIEDVAFLTATFANADAVYCMVPFNFGADNQDAYLQNIANNYLQAIVKNNIQRVVFLTGWAVTIIESLNLQELFAPYPNINYTELRPSIFYTNFYSFIGVIKEHGALMANYGDDDQLAFVAPQDIALAAAEELTSTTTGNTIRYVASEELTCNEAAHILGNAIGQPQLKWITLSSEQALQGYLQMGFPESIATALVNMQAVMHSGEIYNNYLKHRPTLGPTKLDVFAKEFAQVYHQSE